MTPQPKIETLSSPYSFFYKFILPVVWFVGFGYGTRQILFAPDLADPRWLQYCGTWLGITFCIIFATGFIKTVRFDRQNNQLIVSNFFKTISIDCNEIDDIDGSSFLSPKLVWFIIKSPSGFGRKIAFLPVNRNRQKLGKHPLVMELRTTFDLDKKL